MYAGYIFTLVLFFGCTWLVQEIQILNQHREIREIREDMMLLQESLRKNPREEDALGDPPAPPRGANADEEEEGEVLSEGSICG